ncbi:MAG: ABC transporter ATP-binding protein [Bacillota bacterium]
MLKLFRYLKSYRLVVAVTLGLVLLQTLAELYLPTLMAEIVDKGIVNGDIGLILQTGGRMLLVAAGGMVSMIVASYLSARTAVGFGRDLRSHVFSRVESFSLNEFNQIGTASLITRTTNDITQVQTVLLMIIRMAAMAPLMCIGGVIMAVSKDPRLSLLLVVVIPVLGVTIGVIAVKGIPLFKEMQVKLDKINLVVREALTGIRVIRAFNRTEQEKQRFMEANYNFTDTAIRVNRIMAALMPVLMLVMNLTTISIVWFGGIRIDSGHMQVGDMMAFIQYAMQIMFSLIIFSMMFIMIPRASASAMRINELLDTVAEIKDPAVAVNPDQEKGLIEFRDVTFSYPGAERPAVSNISFFAGPGEVTAFIGGTGSGKSTLMNLIPRFYDVDSGAILIDSIDVRQMKQESLRAKIGYVPQKIALFSGSISENIRYGKEEAGEAAVVLAAAIAQADEFITAMQDGYAAIIAQGGANISGGQKQRLAIARALIRKPEIYIFDDSFSSLDFKTEARLRAALREDTTRSTVLIVAQRVSTVMHADRIIVMEEGKIAGTGTHKELLERCTVYQEIVASQFSEEEIA